MNILIAGTGNVAHFMSRKIASQESLHVWNWGRNKKEARTISSLYDTKGLYEPEKRNIYFDLIILAVADMAIEEVGLLLDGKGELIVHTAGAIPLTALKLKQSSKGVFYPLQTISSAAEVSCENFFCLLEAEKEEHRTLLSGLARSMGLKPSKVESIERAQVHLAAVLVNNFVNHIYHQAFTYLNDAKLNPEMLQPLIEETSLKLRRMKPYEAQTGPARRDDQQSIAQHLALLQHHESLKEIYNLFNRLISNTYKHVQDQTTQD